MTATLAAWQWLLLSVLAYLTGYAAGVAACWHPAPEDPGPRHSPPPPGEAPQLPRAGLFPTTPMSLLSDHQAVLAADEAEIRWRTREAENLFGRTFTGALRGRTDWES